MRVIGYPKLAHEMKLTNPVRPNEASSGHLLCSASAPRLAPTCAMPPAPPPKRKRGAGISIFQSDAPTKTARKKAAEHSVFDHGINRADALGLGGPSQQPTLHAPVWASALGLAVPIATPIPGLHGGAGAYAIPGLALRRTRSRGCELSGAAAGTSSSAMPTPLPSGPIPGLSMRRTRSGRILLDAGSSMPAWPAVATAVDQSHASRAVAAMKLPPPPPLQPTLSEWGNLGLDAGSLDADMARLPAATMPRTAAAAAAATAAAAMMMPPPPPLQPTLSEWGNMGLDMGLLADGERLPGLSMRRTRSRGPLYSGPESSAAWGSSASHNAAPLQSAQASHHASHHLPPALPMMPSLSEAALAIGLDMQEATAELLADGPPTDSPSQRRRRAGGRNPLELGIPLRRARSRGHAPLAPPALPMTHSISELVNSFIDSTPAGPDDDSSDTLRLCEQLH